MREVGLNHNELAILADEITGQGGAFSIKARGWSMYPFIHDRDVLTISTVKINNLKSGDIILYKSFDDRIVIHRFLGRSMIGNREILKMRGDALSGLSEYILANKVLGRVVTLRRGSKVIDLQKGFFKFFTHIWVHTYPVGSLCLYSAVTIKKIFTFILRSSQGLRVYRTLAQMFIGTKARYLIITDDFSLSSNKLKESFSFFDIASIRNRSSGYEIRAFIGEKNVGSVMLFRFTDNNLLYPDWWLFGMSVRTAYRGAGIGENLLLMAINKAFEAGTNRLNLLVFEKNKIAIKLYKKIGFRKISIPALDEQLEKEVQHGYLRRIIMSRILQK